MQETIRKLALVNALKFKGKANPKALIGAIAKEYPEAKKDMQNTMQTINTIVVEVNSLSLEEQKKQLLSLDPEFDNKQQAAKEKRKEERSNLPELPNVTGKVITRIPPEPSKYNHLGHAMSFLINYLYAKKYEGKVILRFDDTNPEKSAQEYVDAVYEDVVKFLEIKVDEEKYASEHMQQYYEYAETLVNNYQAYVCSCAQETIAKNRREMIPCAHRNQPVDENQNLWEMMKEGSCEEGVFTLRLKIDMRHKNAVMRDPVIYRVSKTPHYKQKNNYNVWPMYDFECAIEEGLCNVTHVMRSNEFDSRIELQNHIAGLFNFPPVTYVHYGRYNVIGATTKGREIRELIETGNYIGWDDPRLVTIRALRRRGIVKEAFYELAQKIGLSKTQTNLDFSTIAAINRKLLDKEAKRFFAITDPVVVQIKNMPEQLKAFILSYHPEQEKGERQLAATNEYYIEKKDNDAIQNGTPIRFMDAMNLQKIDATTYEYISTDYEAFKQLQNKGPLLHFVPKDGNEIHAELLNPDLTTTQLICEPGINTLGEGEVIQFERFAFVRLDKKGEKPVFWYTHD